MITAQDFSARMRRAAAAMADQRVDAMILTPGPDQYYLTGFEHGHAAERLLALVLRPDGTATWITPVMNEAQVLEKSLPDQVVRAWTDAEGYLPALRDAVRGVECVAWDEEARSAFLLDLREVLPTGRVVRSGDVMRRLRLCKTAEELQVMRAAARTVDETITEAVALCAPGRTELQIEADLRTALVRRSRESSVAFCIVASGPNSAMPHHENGARPVREGEVVILDFGTHLHGYYSDITVTCCIGEPADPEVRKVYRVVWEAQQRAIEAVRPGVPCSAIDRAARGHIESEGYGPHFLHRTGHGLGLQVHEPPNLVSGYETLLEEGMSFSIEPGIYLAGRFGVRLEVIVSVGPDGVSPINAPSSRELLLTG